MYPSFQRFRDASDQQGGAQARAGLHVPGGLDGDEEDARDVMPHERQRHDARTADARGAAVPAQLRAAAAAADEHADEHAATTLSHTHSFSLEKRTTSMLTALRGASDGARHGARVPAVRRAPRAPAKRVYCSAPTPVPPPPSTKKHGEVSLAMGLAAGGFAGVLSALSGVGGGMVLIPAVAKMTNFSMQTVNGTCLGGLTAGAVVGAYNYSQADACNYPLALLTSIPAIAFARVGVKAAHKVSSSTLSSIVGFGMLTSVPFILLKNSEFLKNLRAKNSAESSADGDATRDPLDLQYYHTNHKKDEQPDSEKPESKTDRDTAMLLEAIVKDPLAFAAANFRYVAVGAFAGFISGLCGIGGTMVTTTYLTAGTDMPQAIVIGTTLVSVLPMAMSANYFNYKNKSIHFPTALKIGSSLVIGTYCTSKFILQYQKVPEDFLRAVLATTISAAAIAMIRRPL